MMNRTPLDHWIAQTALVGRPMEPDALFAWQLQRLGETMEHAKDHSSFYARHLEGFSPPKSYEELAGLPLLEESDLRRAGNRMICLSQAEISRVVTLDTSSTTGPAKRLWFTQAEQAHIVDFFAAGMLTLTGPGDRVLILLPCERPGSVGDLLAEALLRIGAQPIRHGPLQSLAPCLHALEAGGANVVVGAPTPVRALAVYARALGRKPGLKSVLLSTDLAPRAAVAAIENQFGCPVFDHYGMTEMGLGGGVECEAHQGYHLRDLDLLFEVVDPITLAPAAEGAYGEVVFSTLRRRALPLIRYRTGDISRFLGDPCPCGSPFRRLERIQGRLGGGLDLGKGRLEMRMLDEALFGLPDLLDFRAFVDRAGPVACLKIEAAVLEGRLPWSQVEAALAERAGIARALEAGELRLEGWVRVSADWPAMHGGKRRLETAHEK